MTEHQDESSTLNAPDWVEKDQRYLWHSVQTYAASQNPLVVAGGDGPWVVDIEGKRYLDAMSGLWCVNLGYSESALADSANSQLRQMPYYPLTQTHLPAIELAEKLNEWLAGDYKIFFSNSGSEANETAFKLVRQYHDQNGEPSRWKFISRYRAYHGGTMASLAATGQAQRKYKYEPLTPGFVHVPPPDCYHCPFGQTAGSCGLECAEIYDRVITWEGSETVAGVIMEPVITGGGMIVPPLEYMARVREICDKHGVLLMVDEVICGFGRSGQRFGHQNFGVRPDVVTMAKGITSGYLPLAATAVRSDLFDAFRDTHEYAHFRHVNTFGGNPVACMVGLRTLELMEERRLVQRAAELGEKLSELLKPLADHPNVGDIRHFGFLAGIELVADKNTKNAAPVDKVSQVVGLCRSQGVIIGKNGDTVHGQNNVLTISPPFVVTDEEVALIVDAVRSSIETVFS